MDSAFDSLKRLCPTLSVGLLTADLSALGSEISLLEQADVGLVHIDVMDGCFCPYMTVGPPFIKAVKTSLLKDVHLMIEDPIDKIADYAAAGADIITVHVESTRHIHRALQVIGSMTNVNDANRGIIRGVGLCPGTPIEAVRPLLDEVDMVSLLAVNPGWSGQKFAETTTQRLRAVRQMIEDAKRDILTCIDGGITRSNIAEVARTGVDIVVAGSAVFDGKSPLENARFMLDAIKTAAAQSAER